MIAVPSQIYGLWRRGAYDLTLILGSADARQQDRFRGGTESSHSGFLEEMPRPGGLR